MPLLRVCFALVLLLPVRTPSIGFPEEMRAQHAQNIEYRKYLALTKFFQAYDAPAPYYISDYLSAARKHNLDYRLLPVISLLESGAGKHTCGDGIRRWGYGNCKGYVFATVPEGIEYISAALENSEYYRGKSLEAKLKQYNPENPHYPAIVMGLMAEIQHSPASPEH